MLQRDSHPAMRPAHAQLVPEIHCELPGPRSREFAARLERVESRNVTYLDGTAPIFWEEARGVNVWDVDGNRLVDLSGAFGVANVGHAHPRVSAAIGDQARRLLHAMGDVQPPRIKVDLLEALVRRYPGGADARGVLLSSGSDAVEYAIKSAQLATGRSGIVAFDGAYHGLALGALDATARSDFRRPFEARLPRACEHAAYGDADSVDAACERLRARGIETGAVLVEPVQGRGGDRVPPQGFLRSLRSRCDERGWLLIADEVYTGFGRTGRWFACEHEGVTPDLLCVGKGLASGMPISACLGRVEVMEAWPPSHGEALHTQTFLGHPTSCAAALASIAVLDDEALVEASARTGALALDHARERLGPIDGVADVRGLGLMIGIACTRAEVAKRACAEALQRGYILLPSGDDGRVLSITPPLCIEAPLLLAALDAVGECLERGGAA